MASPSHLAAEKKRRMSTQAKQAQRGQDIATRHSDRIAAIRERSQSQARFKRRTRCLTNIQPAEARKRAREDEIPGSSKREQTSVALASNQVRGTETISEAPVILIARSTQVSETRNHLRSQNATEVASPIHAPISQTACNKRKRARSKAEAERPVKRPRRNPSHLESLGNSQRDSQVQPKIDTLDPPPLSTEAQEDLGTLYKEVMNSLKRSSSRRSMTSEVETVRSQRSSNTAAHYRYKHLEDANVYVHVDPPNDIQAVIDHIINAEPSEDRRSLLRDQAKTFQIRCKEMVRAAAGEDDFVHLFYNVIELLSPRHLMSREKADWRLELKPTIRQSNENLSFLLDFEALSRDKKLEIDEEANEALPPSKRHQQFAGHPYISPQHSQAVLSDSQNSKLPELEKAKDTSPIKTPRPDITTGIKEQAIISALALSLSLLNVAYTKTRTINFLKTLQAITMGGPPEPMLIMIPTQRESKLTFPTLIFEGKGYSTGKPIFEAQNQAAVSGASGVKIQMMLNDLVKHPMRNSVVPPTTLNRHPLVFSICSEGPQHELWAHYTVMEDGEDHFNMVLLSTCYGVILNQVERFLIQVDNVLNWSAGPFLKSVVDDLGKIAKDSRV